ncbi:hypothetical protein JCM8115_001085 [Rhodotorula mucilaginosa]|uniref:Cleft lip and palate associated transmembrane protein n=1 Tax=Rhodotorula mucilaginosa TaxID=5537 RepID=A0A9P6W771_RHOMI|nr:hypothetical protein C6P46_001230 [Rhodotorula mucilaginosa]TKA58067.1 hypothetical protein B0A53_00469 [Rhodotorula sp. CCFEE 5036]
MATPAAAPAAAPPAADPQDAARGVVPILKQVALGYIGVQAIQYFLGTKVKPPSPPPTAQPILDNAAPPAGPASAVNAPAQAGAEQQRLPAVVPVWAPKSTLDVALKLSTDEDPLNVDLRDQTLPGVTWEGIEYASGKWNRVWETEWNVPESVQNNASLYLDAFITQSGKSPVRGDPTYPGDGDVLHVRKPLTRYQTQRKVRAVKNLLTGKSDKEKAEAEAAQQAEDEKEETEEEWKARPIVSFYHPNVTLDLVVDSGAIELAKTPPPVRSHIHIARDGAKTYDNKQAYFPIVFPNDFWLLSSHMNPINSTVSRLPLRVEMKPTSLFKFQIQSSLSDSFAKQSEGMSGGMAQLDEIKRILVETNPLLLVTTLVVSLLHMLFEFLAFTSDVSHWRNKKELVGVSIRTILTNVFTQAVILLYLIDSSEETNATILFSSAIGLAIEAWKITKAVDVKVIKSTAGSSLPYKLSIKDKHVLSEDEKKTQEFDKLAFRYVAWCGAPILFGWTIYSLLYQQHRSTYSFVIQTLTSFLQWFGFCQLIPQLIINYKLKSVAHIPMKAMGYKVLSTVIDDFFSFIIKMPLLHRLACFRDDVVFLILLYQMWIYKVDPTRENEYGQKLSKEEAEKLLQQQNADKANAPAKEAGEEKKEPKIKETKKNK